MAFLLGNPYVLGGILLLLLSSHTGAFWWGHRTAAKTCAIEKAEMVEASNKQKEEELGQAIAAATSLEVKNAQTKVVFREITKTVDRVVEKPVYRELCFDSDGLLLANSALAGTRPAPAQPDPALPGPVTP